MAHKKIEQLQPGDKFRGHGTVLTAIGPPYESGKSDSTVTFIVVPCVNGRNRNVSFELRKGHRVTLAP